MTAFDLSQSQLLGNGMVIAAGIVAERDPVAAREILVACGWTTFRDLRANGVDEYDIKLLRHVVKDLGFTDVDDVVRGYASIDRLAA